MPQLPAAAIELCRPSADDVDVDPTDPSDRVDAGDYAEDAPYITAMANFSDLISATAHSTLAETAGAAAVRDQRSRLQQQLMRYRAWVDGLPMRLCLHLDSPPRVLALQ